MVSTLAQKQVMWVVGTITTLGVLFAHFSTPTTLVAITMIMLKLHLPCVKVIAYMYVIDLATRFLCHF